MFRNLPSIMSFASVTPSSARYQSWTVIVVPVTFILARLKVGAESTWREPIPAYNRACVALVSSRGRIARLSRFGLCFRLCAVSHRACRSEQTRHKAIIVCIYIYSDRITHRALHEQVRASVLGEHAICSQTLVPPRMLCST